MKMVLHKLKRLILVVVTVFVVASCSDDGSNEPATSDAGDVSVQDTTDSAGDTTSNSCGDNEYRGNETDVCETCPSTEFSCSAISLNESSVDTSTNVVEIPLSASLPITSATASGMKTTGGGVGGGVSEPISVEGTISGTTLTFDFGEHSDADELQVSNLAVQGPCVEGEASATLTVRWEPEGDVTGDFACLPGLGR